METELSHQALSLALAVLTGAAFGLIYDILRPPRQAVGALAAALLDGVFCLCCGAGAFLLAMSAGNGRLGLWELASMLAGFCLYMHLLSPAVSAVLRTFLRFGAAVLETTRKNMKKALKFINLVFQKLKECFIIKRNGAERK